MSHTTGPIRAGLAARLRGDGLTARLMRGGAGSLAVKAGSMGLTLLVTVVLARALGPAGYGVYAYAFALVSLLGAPSQLGLPTLVLRETARAEAAGDGDLMRRVWRWAARTAALTSLIIVGAAALALALAAGRLHADMAGAFAWGLVLIPVVALANLAGAALQGLRRVVQGQLQEFILRPGLLALAVLAAVALMGAGALGAPLAMALHAAAALAGLVVTLWLLRRPTLPPQTYAPSVPGESRAWLAATLPLAALTGMQMINAQVGVLVIGLFGDAADVGVYRVVMQGGTLLALSTHAIGMAAAPHMARLHAQDDLPRLQRLATTCALATTAITVPACLIFMVWGREVLVIAFGSAYAAGGLALAVVAAGRLAGSFFGCIDTLLPMTGHERDSARSLAVSTTANLLLNLALVPRFGLIGAAAASTVALALWYAMLWRVTRRAVRIDSSLLAILGAAR